MVDLEVVEDLVALFDVLVDVHLEVVVVDLVVDLEKW